MDKQPEISVIVPVYNVEKYLPHCLDSILASTFKDIEVILVDDCGPDNSRAICDEYAAKDARVRVISNPHNMGVSAARNNGLDNARGKYISFIDSDDYIDATMFEKLHTAMERENVDMVGCNAWSVEESGKKELLEYLGVKHDVRTSFTELGDKIFSSAFHIWRCLYRKELLRDIRFYPKVAFVDDAVFMIEVYPYLNDIYFLAEPLYFYRRLQNTLSTQCNKRNFEILNLKDIVIKIFDNNPKANIIRDGFWNWYTDMLCGFYDMIPMELLGVYTEEVRKILPYTNYRHYIEKIECSVKKYYLFDFIPLLTIKKRGGKTHIKLFGKLPLLKIKHI